MAYFEPAFEKMIRNEGGFFNHKVEGDRGGQTYAGIARNYHPDWKGWELIDRSGIDNPALTQLVREFYQAHFWCRIKGDSITSQAVADTIFDFAVNAGVRTAVRLAQLAVNATPDGIFGQKTLARINAVRDAGRFADRYALLKVKRYVQIVRRDRSQLKFMLGWLNRTLKSAA